MYMILFMIVFVFICFDVAKILLAGSTLPFYQQNASKSQYNTADDDWRIGQKDHWRFCHLHVAKPQPTVDCKERSRQIMTCMESNAIPDVPRPDEHQTIYHSSKECTRKVAHMKYAEQHSHHHADSNLCTTPTEWRDGHLSETQLFEHGSQQYSMDAGNQVFA